MALIGTSRAWQCVVTACCETLQTLAEVEVRTLCSAQVIVEQQRAVLAKCLNLIFAGDASAKETKCHQLAVLI